MRFARRVFRIAAVYGVLVLAPQYFMEARVGQYSPAPIVHPEHFYGFVGVALAWQIAFLIIALDPVRYRLLMLAAILEKLSWGGATVVLFLEGRLDAVVLAFGLVDLVLALLFFVAYQRTPAMGLARPAPARAGTDHVH